jgi:DNA-directed RNA polymerase II subunit RPB2
MELREDTVWKLIDTYFRNNPQALVRHHVDSYNEFFKHGIQQTFRETNPLKLELDYDNDKKIQDFRAKCHMYFGGKDGSKIYIGKPTIQDDGNPHYMFPNECRLRNMTYGMTVHYDLEIEFTRILRDTDRPTTLDDKGSIVFECDFDDEDKPDATTQFTPGEFAKMREKMQSTLQDQNVQTFCMTLEKMYLGKFPIMVQSDFCILQGLPREMRHRMGECKNDIGGYFIIDGKEKTVVCQEKFGDNMMYIRKASSAQALYSYSAEIRSVSENVSKPIRTLKVQVMASTPTLTKNNIVVIVPNIRVPVPLFILFRALGITTDREIISMCTLQDASKTHPKMVEFIDASIHDSGTITTQHDALKLLSMYIKGQTITRTMHVLADYFLPHVGEVNFLHKAYYLGYMVNRLLSVATGIEEPTDRDNYKYKRVELVGPMMKELFREYYKKEQHHIRLSFERIYDPNKGEYADIASLIYKNYKEVFREKLVDTGFRKAFKGDWGSEQHTKRIGVTQDLNRLSHNGMLSHLRKTNLPLDASVKIVGPRLLHSTQWGLIDPIDTPDGGNIGLHKHLAIMTTITSTVSREPILAWLRDNSTMVQLHQCVSSQIFTMTKIMVNGYWAGVIHDPVTLVKEMRLHRRHGLLPVTTSVSFEIAKKVVHIFTDGGRLCRPLFYRDEITNKFVFETSEWKKLESVIMDDNKCTWDQIISGFHPKSDGTKEEPIQFDPMEGKIYKWEELYKVPKNDIKRNKALLEYIDTNESENALVAMNQEAMLSSPLQYTHREIHESTTFGVLCNLINFPEHNPATRNSFSCGQSKQACSMYSTNHQVRMDKSAVLLNYGQIPLVKSRYMEYINHEENPYGENAIVAIMCYTGYNVEDAVLINEGALQRGLFRTTYYTTYESHEEKEIKRESVVKETVFGNIENTPNVMGTKEGCDYSLLDEHGVIRENVEVNEKTILIGMSSLVPNKEVRKDASKKPKKGQLGYVDKVFMTDGEEGQRIAKVRIREERIPNMGDKFASRAGQKGTIGMVIPEEDMPYTKDGIRPDMIVNPHALPSRMTIGQIIECITGKLCATTGTFGDCTAYHNKASRLGTIGELLTGYGFHSTGNEVMYNGMTGGQMESEIFMGPTYYMRLKHMVKDKINFRGTGPRTNLTRQPVSGRANDGGLRIGEMERDAVISHGASMFLQESMMKRGDQYKMAVCNQTGMVAVYNPARNLLLSPLADGPLQYTGSLMTGELEVQQLTRFGRSFSVVEIPYSLKLLMQELQTINVRLSLITEDNISQLDNMAFSKNIAFMLPTSKDKTAKGLIRKTQEMIKKVEAPKPMVDEEVSVPRTPTPETESPQFQLDATSTPEPMLPGSPEGPPPPLFPEDPALQEIYENLKPRVKEKIKDWSNRDKQWLVKEKQKRMQAKEGIQMGGEGGNNDTMTNLRQKGDKVHCYGDSRPQREWIVDKVGNNLYGIYTLDNDQLDTEEHYKYVRPEEVYTPGNYLYVNEIEEEGDDSDDELLQQLPPPMIEVPTDMMPPVATMPAAVDDGRTNINFNPVIKVITDGNDNSQGIDPGLVHPGSGPVSVQPDQQGNLLQSHTTPEAVAIEPAVEDSVMNFNQPIIVKKG